jgi:hypothetical protein
MIFVTSGSIICGLFSVINVTFCVLACMSLLSAMVSVPFIMLCWCLWNHYLLWLLSDTWYTGLIKTYPIKGQENKITNLRCCSTNPLLSSSLSDTTRLFQQSFHCPKHFWNWLFGIANSCIVTFHFISSVSWNVFPFNSTFISGNWKKSHVTMSGELGGGGGCGTYRIWCLAKKFWVWWDSTVSSFGTNFIDVLFMHKSSVRMDCNEPSESPNLSESSLIVILRLSSTAEHTL